MHKINPKIVMLTNDEQIDRRILLQASSLQRDGWDVVILTNHASSKIENDGVQIICSQPGQGNDQSGRLKLIVTNLGLHLYRTIRKYFLPTSYFWQWLRSKITNKISPDLFYKNFFESEAIKQNASVYVAHDLPMLTAAHSFAKKLDAKLVYDSHELFVEQEFTTDEKNIWSSIENKHIKSCNEIITINASIASELAKRYAIDNVHVIYNSEQLCTLPAQPVKKFHQIFNLPDCAQILLYQGALLFNRNLDTLLSSMKQMKNKDIHLVYLGDGSVKATLQKQALSLGISNNVHFHKTVPQNDLLSYTQSADVGIIPYQATCLNNYFCTPNKLFEFIAAGIPIIASDLPEIRKIIVPNKIGIVGDTAEPKALAQLIDNFFDNKESLLAAKEAVLQTRQEINWEVEEKKLISIYGNLKPNLGGAS